MTNIFTLILSVLVTATALATTTPAAEPTPKKIDLSASAVIWKGYKVLGEHEGTIQLSDGELLFDGDILTGGSFTIDMSTIATTDLSGGSAKKLDGHLKSPDFFGVEAHPAATFVITSVVPRGKTGDYKVVGNLTIKDSTKEIKFNALVNDGSATADITIDRTEYDVKYGSGAFFDNLGDKTIYDEFDLKLNLKY